MIEGAGGAFRGVWWGLCLFILSGVLWLDSTHTSCPLFSSSCQSLCTPKLACLLLDYLNEHIYHFIPFYSSYKAHPTLSENSHLSIFEWTLAGGSYKKIKKSETLVWWSWIKAWVWVCRGLVRISWWLVVINSIWNAFWSAGCWWIVHILASSKEPQSPLFIKRNMPLVSEKMLWMPVLQQRRHLSCWFEPALRSAELGMLPLGFSYCWEL